MSERQSRAHHIRSLFPQQTETVSQYEYGYEQDYGGHNMYYSPTPYEQHQYTHQGYYPNYNGGDDEGDEEMSPQEIKAMELELRRQNPDLLDKIRFAFKDRKYGTLFGQALKAAFYGAGIITNPHIVIPLAALQAITRSRKKQVQRRDAGIKPRYHIRPEDTY